MKYDLLVTDFDGTLGMGAKIEKETVDAIKKFIEKGGKFCICTGRHYFYIKDVCETYGIKGLLAVCQGASIIDLNSEKTIFRGGIEREKAAKLAKLMREDGYNVSVYFDDKLYYENLSEYAEMYKSGIVPTGKVDSVSEYILSRTEDPLKMIITSVDGALRKKEDKYRETVGEGFEFNTSGGNFVEVVNPKSGKGEAVKTLSEIYGIPYEKIITVGDAENDLRLVDGPWHGVAVGDADERLKKVAKEVTVPYSEKPIKTLLEKYCLE